MKIPFLDLKIQYETIKEEINTKIRSILESAQFVLGNDLNEFESEFANYIGTTYSLGLNSGTGALWLALKALNIEPGDEVITVSNSFIATWEAIALAGGKAIFVDIDPDTFLIDPRKIESAITNRTKFIIPVHLYGAPCEMDKICEIAKKYKLSVIEDACQAHGAVYKGIKAGAWGDIGCFSFYPGKNLGAYGDGGAITTNSENLYNKIKMLRDHGQTKKYNHEILGYNERLDNIQAGVLRVKLKYLDNWNRQRRKIVSIYDNEFSGQVKIQILPNNSLSAHHLYVIRNENRDRLLEKLNEYGVMCGLHYPVPIHKQKAYISMGGQIKSSLVETQSHCDELLSLPLYPELKDYGFVVEAVKKALS